MVWLLNSSIVAICLSLAPSASAPNERAHDKEFWRAIARDHYKLPAGESAGELMRELSTCLGSPDPELRDELAYAISAQWVYRQRLLEREELLGLVHTWTANLKQGIGKSGDDTVLLRSFSALCLSIAAALDNDEAFLEPPEFRALLDAALGYLAAERDLRGFERAQGWLHATAHTADLLKFLARSPQLAPADQARLWTGIADRLASTGEVVFTHGEDGRLARVAVSLVLREDFDAAAWDAWLARLRALQQAAAAAPDFDPARFAALQNTSNLLRHVFVLLSCLETPTAAVVKARADALACLREFG